MTALCQRSLSDFSELPSKSTTEREFLNLRPVRAVLMMQTYSAAEIVQACKFLQRRGRNLSVDSILDVLNNGDILTLENNDNKKIETDELSVNINKKKIETDSPVTNKSNADRNCHLTALAYHCPSSNEGKDNDLNEDVLDFRTKVLPQNKFKDKLETDGKGKHADNNNQLTIDKKIEIENMAKENERIKKSRLCRKCGNHQADIILLPCRHISVCHNCWDPKVKANCPQCKVDVAGMFHVFWG